MRRAATATIVPLALLLAACGSSDDADSDSGSSDSGSSYADTAPEDIQQDVVDAMQSVTSLHVSGNIVTDQGDPLDMDLSIADNGNCEGTMAVAGSGSFQLIVSGDQAFIKADEDFWRASAGSAADQIITAVGDSWVTATGSMSSVGDACDWEQFTSSWDDEGGDGGVGEVQGTEDVDGQETVKVAYTSDDGTEGTAWVLTDEPHYFVKVDAGEDGTIELSEFNEPVEPEIPTDVVDLSSLQ